MTASSSQTTQSARKAEASAADIERRIAQLKDDITGLTSAVTDFGARKAGALGDSAASATADMAEAAERALEQARAEVAALERSMIGHVRSNPLQALAIAAGIGFLAALIMRR